MGSTLHQRVHQGVGLVLVFYNIDHLQTNPDLEGKRGGPFASCDGRLVGIKTPEESAEKGNIPG